jgi:phosphonate transport system substrate-binding protein
MRNRYKLYLFSLLTFFACNVTAAENSTENKTENALIIGVVPYMTARVLINNYEPVRHYLEQALGKPVHIYTANGFKQFLLNAQKGYYDVVINAAHFARILQKENNFKPILHFSMGTRALVMVSATGPIKSAQDLRGKLIAVPDKLALAAIVAMTKLREEGLIEGTDYRVLTVPSFTAAILAVQNGDANAAVTAQAVMKQMPEELQHAVRPLIDAGEFSNLVILTHPRLAKSESVAIANLLQNFEHKNSAGKQFINAKHIGEIVTVNHHDMQVLDRYIAETKRLLNE